MIYQRELAIVIPCKNEENYIGVLLRSLSRQTYNMSSAQIVVADAGSTDRTPGVIRQFQEEHPWMSVEVIQGGMPSVGRNRGAAHTDSGYILFVDADVELRDGDLIRRALFKMRKEKLHCATTDIKCGSPSLLSATMYGVSNIAQRLSRLSRPYSTGMFMLFERKTFEKLGGFDEAITFAEDYDLSSKVASNKFRVIPGHIFTSNRRFQRSGYLKVTKLFLGTAFRAGRRAPFSSDHNYWHGSY